MCAVASAPGGSWGGQRPSLADYVTLTGTKEGVTASGCQESMCCGTPVITTPCGGGPECIEDGVDGWIVPPRDIDALVERLRFCAANRDAVFEVGRRARARAERWTWRDAGDALVRALA